MGTSLDGIDRQLLVVGGDQVVEVDLAVLVDRVPHGEGHAEESLSRDVPVDVEALDPRPVAVAHVVRVPAQLLAARQQFVASFERAHEPLA